MIFKKRDKEEKEAEPVAAHSGFFTTDIVTRSSKNLSALIAGFAFPKKQPKGITASGEVFSTDGCEGASVAFGFGSGTGLLPENLFSWYVSQGFIGYQACAIMAQHWLVDKACTIAPKDAARKGYDITVNSGDDISVDVIDRLREIDRDFHISKNLVEFAKFNRVFGIRIALFHVESDDPDYYLKPFNIDGVKRGSYKGISQVDPYWMTPELDMNASSNSVDMHFYEPTWWRINGRRYHRTHLVVIRASDVADVLKPTYQFGGIPLPQRIYERIYAAERTANEAPLLAMTKRTTVLKVDIEAALGDQASFEQKLNTWIQYRDNQGVKVCGLDEDMTQTDTSLGDLDSVIMTQYQLVAAECNTPATKLIGTSLKGFATGEYEEANYHEYLETIQNDEMLPLLERHYMLSIKSDPFFADVPEFTVSVAWKPLDSLTEVEMADVRLKNAQTAQALQSTGAIDGLDIRKTIIADKFSGWNGLQADSDESLPDFDDLGLGEPDIDSAPSEPAADVVANATLTNLTGKQFQNLERIMRKVRNGTLTEAQGKLMLMQSFGFSDEQAAAFVETPEADE